jgi:hypothetical protein
MLAGTAAVAQSDLDVSVGCTLSHDQYTCDRAKFDQVFAKAKTAAIETAPTDAVAQAQLKRLIAAAGKTLVTRNEHPDITFLLVPVDAAGVQYTSNQTQLAALRVFAASPDSAGRGNLVWAENQSGQVDAPWFAVVNRLVGQFKSRFHLKG